MKDTVIQIVDHNDSHKFTNNVIGPFRNEHKAGKLLLRKGWRKISSDMFKDKKGRWAVISQMEKPSAAASL